MRWHYHFQFHFHFSYHIFVPPFFNQSKYLEAFPYYYFQFSISFLIKIISITKILLGLIGGLSDRFVFLIDRKGKLFRVLFHLTFNFICFFQLNLKYKKENFINNSGYRCCFSCFNTFPMEKPLLNYLIFIIFLSLERINFNLIN